MMIRPGGTTRGRPRSRYGRTPGERSTPQATITPQVGPGEAQHDDDRTRLLTEPTLLRRLSRRAARVARRVRRPRLPRPAIQLEGELQRPVWRRERHPRPSESLYRHMALGRGRDRPNGGSKASPGAGRTAPSPAFKPSSARAECSRISRTWPSASRSAGASCASTQASICTATRPRATTSSSCAMPCSDQEISAMKLSGNAPPPTATRSKGRSLLDGSTTRFCSTPWATPGPGTRSTPTTMTTTSKAPTGTWRKEPADDTGSTTSRLRSQEGIPATNGG